MLWIRFALRQIATALTVVTSMLLLSEILLPGSILPYYNLHILIIITLIIVVLSPTIEKKSRIIRYALCATLGALLLIYAWLLFGMSVSGLMLLGALGMVVVGVMVALGTAAPSWVPPPLAPPQDEEGEGAGEGVGGGAEVDIFMR